jgi:type II secretory pathway component PulK
MNDRGVALLAVLWVIAVIGTVASAGIATAQGAVWAATHRITGVRARWAAESCLALGRAALQAVAAGGGLSELIPERITQQMDSVALGVGVACRAVAQHASKYPVNIHFASISALRELPGFDDETVGAVRRIVRRGERIDDFAELLAVASEAGRRRLLAAAGSLDSLITYRTSRIRVQGIGIVHGKEFDAVREEWALATNRIAVVGRLVR